MRSAAAAVGAAAVGAALGATSVTGHALLLYSGHGFLRAVGLLVALTFAAVAAGIWGTGGNVPDGNTVARRWRWFVLTVMAGGVFIAVADRVPALRTVAPGAALATLLTVAAPAYAGAATLTAMASRAGTTVVAVAAVGVGVGVFGTTAVLVPRLDAASVYFLAGAWAAAAAFLPDTGRRESRSMDLSGKVVLVTGAGNPGQVGFAIAERCLAAGARVIVTARSPDVAGIAARLGPEDMVIGVPADLGVTADLDRLARTIRERFGRLDAVMNVAGGLTLIKPLAETSLNEWRREIERNADTVHATSVALLALLRESGGAIVNFASPAGLRAARNLGAYSAAKAAVVAHTRALALEEKANGVRVNAIAPGMVDTEQNRASVEDPERTKWVTREEIADVAVFLASAAASGISGETVHVLGDGLR